MTWWSRQQPGALFITTVTMAEIMYGTEILPHGKRRLALLAGAEQMFGKVLAGRILPFDENAARAFPEIAARRRARGRPITDLDAQIAAIAFSRGAILATRDTADFEGCGVRLVNPWTTS